MITARPYAHLVERLKAAKLRPTRQRLALAKLLFDNGDRHITAEILHDEVLAAGMKVSLATVYNSLHQFTEAGLLREVIVDSGRSYFDTNTVEHHHFYHVEKGELEDVPDGALTLGDLPAAPDGTTIERVDVIIRVR
ncbi:MAG TPA: transcriptional repressor [Rhodospirillaceae bacterium]|nr:transcriptional repressor [Rhodospirillaceae bacterium]HAA90874.1 transcriptional repressor [Rhodospirillaceae bacterium]HAT35071.1 transcriptional repressor [Rhodospirillaceae bacterium]|tara:strand:+ start:107 stop:517 length:411 start_codon:yes stop_codon:yes gene_type:complete